MMPFYKVVKELITCHLSNLVLMMGGWDELYELNFLYLAVVILTVILFQDVLLKHPEEFAKS